MEQAVTERPVSQNQFTSQRQSWHNGAMDNKGTRPLQDPAHSRGSWTGLEKNVCRDYLRGKCDRGSSCKFQHSDFDANNLRNTHLVGLNKDGDSDKRDLIRKFGGKSHCRNFQSGRCDRGSSCAFFHPETNPNDSGRGPFFSEARQRSLCRNFQNGRCNFGSTCIYSHHEYAESDRPMHDLSAQQHRGVGTVSRNYRFHEGNDNNNLNTSVVHSQFNNENNSRSSYPREPRSLSPCRKFLQGRCNFGTNCRRPHPVNNPCTHNWSEEQQPTIASNLNDRGFSDEGHRHVYLRTRSFSGEPTSGSPCQYFRKGSCYQGDPSTNSGPATVYEKRSYDTGSRPHQGVTASRDRRFDTGNVVREVNGHGPQPEVCLKFTKGRCDLGENCRYLHSFHEYASSISQQRQKAHVEASEDLMNIDTARVDRMQTDGRHHSESNLISADNSFDKETMRKSVDDVGTLNIVNQNGVENPAEATEISLWSPPFKRRKVFPEDDVRCGTLRRDYSLCNQHRNRGHHESPNQYPDHCSIKWVGPANRMSNGQHFNVTATSLNASRHGDNDSIRMVPDGNSKVASHGSERNVVESGTNVLRCNQVDEKVELNHELNENNEPEHIVKAYSMKKRIKQHPSSCKCDAELMMEASILALKGVVLASDHPEQENEAAAVKAQKIMVQSSSAATGSDVVLLGETNDSAAGSRPLDEVILKSKRKLLVLDVNGLLADIVSDFPDRCKPDTTVGGKGVFKRPFCDEFLQFCFDKFDVGIWSSRTKKNVTMVLECLMEKTKDKLLFCWHQSHCTQTGFNTVENKEKPLVLKELKKLWEKEEEDLPWKKGFYDETNTILLDDSPYKALRNPPYTAVFPFPYTFKDVKDKSIGPDGDLRLYLEKLADVENVPKFIQENPFGQRPITKNNLSWAFYSKIVQQQEAIASSTRGNSS